MMHSRSTLILAALACLAAAPLPSLAQTREARQTLANGVRLAQEGDSASALSLFEEATSIDPTYAEAHFRKGLFHSRQSSGRALDFRDRMIAHDAFDEAIRWDPGNPLYLLELGKLLLMQEMRVDARRVLERALDAAERADAPTLAEVHFQLGILKETQWRRFRDRHRLPLGVDQIRGDMAFANPRYVWDMLDASGYIAGQGGGERESMLSHFHRALTANPAHVGAATHLLASYHDEGRTDEFMAESRRFVRAAPAEPRGYLALGLGLHALGRDDEAAGAFEYAIELLPANERTEFLAVSRLLRQDDAEVFDSLAGGDRAEAARRFWTAYDPLYLTPSNEFWVEYLARMAYSDLRFGLPEYRTPGWRTDRGEIWVRYGEPIRQATFSPNTTDTGDFEAVGRVTTVWSYGREGPVFIFRQNPGYRRATFANDFRFYADDYRSIQPARFSAPSIPALVPMPAQIARFRGPDGGMDLEVHAAVPLDSLGRVAQSASATLETGLFVIDPGGAEIRRLVESEDVRFGDGGALPMSWRTTVPQGQPYIVSAEARDPLSWAAGAHRARIDARSFPSGEPSVSDILVGHSLAALVESPRTRADFYIEAEPTLTFGPAESIGLYFELYNLLPDLDQYASYDLDLALTVEEIYREGPVSRLLGALADRWGLTEEGQEAVRLSFNKEDRVVARDLIPEFFTIQLDEPPPGRYGLRLNVRDRNAGVVLTTTRTFEIREP